MVFSLDLKMVTIVKKDLYIKNYNLKHVGEKTACS